ncbi:hypothetical protein JCM11491_004189 [Sporobolomyces phaffii]
MPNKSTYQRDYYRTPPSHALRYFTHSSGSSDDASDDGEDVPPTPGDLDSFRPIRLVPHSRDESPREKGRVEFSKLFANGAGPNSARYQGDGSLSLSPVANVFFPSFGDFLPAVKKQEEQHQTNGLGLSAWDRTVDAETTSDKIDSLSRALARQLEITDDVNQKADTADACPTVASPLVGAAPFAPFSTFSPNTDSFTFFPSPDWKTREGEERESKEATRTSASLRSPEPDAGLAAFPMRKSASALTDSRPLSQVVVTPPSTPSRKQPHHAAPPMQQSRSLPTPIALSPSRPLFAPSPSPTRASFDQSPRLHPGACSPYPLSAADTERIAKLHNGRIPTLEQLCPEPIHPSAQPPIVNTGNQGVMVVQQGDWKCGTCSFVNWRRRKICLRCFPFANDIGNILTIQSQRAAHLATPLSAPAHQTNFLLPSPTRAHFDSYSTNAMSRSTCYPPHISPTRSVSPYAPTYLLAPVQQIPHSASPTRSTFLLPVPPSPTRHMSSSPSSVRGHHTAQLPPNDDTLYPGSTTSNLPALSAASAGELALRRAAKGQRSLSNVARYPSIEPLNLAKYSEMSYSHAQGSRTAHGQSSPARVLYGGGGQGGGSHHDRVVFGGQSPPSPTRYFHSAHQRATLSNGMLNPEL